jgi:hypothetical protein
MVFAVVLAVAALDSGYRAYLTPTASRAIMTALYALICRQRLLALECGSTRLTRQPGRGFLGG